jgi:hypothetical protein
VPPNARAAAAARGHRFAAYPRCSTDIPEVDVSWLLMWLLAAPPQEAVGTTCVPKTCLQEIQQHAPAVAIDAGTADLPGIWVRGGGLAGRLLYLFDDGTFMHSEWADVMPERVFDKGKWWVADGVVVLSSDPDVTWPVRWDQRYLLLRAKGASGELLFGLDRSMVGFRYFVSHASGMSGVDGLQAFGLARTPWQPRQAAQTRKRLMTEAWRPELLTAGK